MGPRRRDRRRRVLLLLLSGVLAASLSAVSAQAATDASVALHMLGEPARTNPNGEPILIAGIWHEFQVNLTGPSPAALSLTFTLSGGAPQTMASDYRWSWNASSGMWSDTYYATFIRDDLSSTDGTHFSVIAGVDAQATPGFWTFRVFEGSTLLANRVVQVEAPSLSYALSAADFVFQVEPFAYADVSSQAAGQYVRAINTGNVPLQGTVAFDGLQSQLSVQNPADTAHPGSDARYYVRLSLDPRPPQILAVNGISRVTVNGLIPSPGSAVLVPSVEQSFGLRVFVGRSGYAVRDLGGVVFQTLEAVRVDYGAIATWQVYLTGDQSVSLSVGVANAKFLGARTSGQPLALPATLVLSPNAEYPVTIQVEANAAGTGTVTFTLTLLGSGDVRTFTTAILVNGGPPPSSQDAVTYLWILGSVAAAAVFGIVSFTQWRHRGGRVSGSRIATDAKPAKRGYNSRRRERARGGGKSSNGNGAKGTHGNRRTGSRGTAPAHGRR